MLAQLETPVCQTFHSQDQTTPNPMQGGAILHTQTTTPYAPYPNQTAPINQLPMSPKLSLTLPEPPDGIPTHLRLAPTSHQAFLDRWIIQSIQIDPHTSTRLNGDNSLYQTYQHACRQREAPPLSLRQFTKRLEILLEFHFHIASTKTRDYKGTFFLGLKLKPVHTDQNQQNALIASTTAPAGAVG